MTAHNERKECISYLACFLMCGGFGWTFMLIGFGIIPGAWNSANMIIISDNPANCTAPHCFTVRRDNFATCVVHEDTNDYQIGEIHRVFYQGDSPVYSACTFDDKLVAKFYILIGLIPAIISCIIVCMFMCCGPTICCATKKKKSRSILPSTAIVDV